MKVAIILAIVLVVNLALHEADAYYCTRTNKDRICKRRCRARRCKSFVAVCYICRLFCRCLYCATEHSMKFPENEGIYPPQMFPQMIDNEFPNLSEEMSKGKQQGETDM